MSVARDTLLVRHLPEELNNEEKESLLKHFGAHAVKCFSGKGPLRNAAFASFNSENEAEQALHSLHQLEILDRYLIVEYAHHKDANYFPHQSDFPKPKKTIGDDAPKKPTVEKKLEEFYHKISGLSRNFSLMYPINPKLRYRYPPCDRNIATNISHALLMVPRFYTQVLHLMNKMSLPPPFSVSPAMSLMFQNDLVSSQEHMSLYRNDTLKKRNSSDESELSSDEEITRKPTQTLTLKRKKNPMAQSLKRPKLQPVAHAKPSEKEVMNPTHVFEKIENPLMKKIELKINKSMLDTDQSVEENTSVLENEPSVGTFGQFDPVVKVNTDETNTEVDKVTSVKPLSRSEIKENRISRDEMKHSSVFKNYKPGEPTTRLYVKNVARQVEERELQTIYLLYVDQHNDTEKNMFDVRLMKEGRMKGQAFINLPNVKRAELAVKETNGYILHGKPLVVQFARSAKPKEETTSK